MQADEKKRLYAKVMGRYGIDMQTLVLAEECAEMVKAASKLCRYFRKLEVGDSLSMTLVNELIEEIADTEIMMEQMEQEYNISRGQIETVKDMKLERLKKKVGI